jgi:hypothetical protein
MPHLLVRHEFNQKTVGGVDSGGLKLIHAELSKTVVE